MKITRVEAIALQVKLPRDFRGSIYSVPQKNAIVTRIHTDEGLVGECVNGEGEAALQKPQVEIIERELTPLLVYGGGLKMGQVVGRSDSTASRPETEAYGPSHLLGTIMHTLFDVGQLRLLSDIPNEIVRFADDAKPIEQLV